MTENSGKSRLLLIRWGLPVAALVALPSTAGPGVASEPVFAPEAAISGGHCVSASTTAAKVRMDNRASSSPITYEVVQVRHGTLRSAYVTVGAGSLRQQSVRTRRATVRVAVRAFDARVAAGLLRARYCRHGAAIGAVTSSAATLTVVNRTARPARFTVETSTLETSPALWQLRVPARGSRSLQVGLRPDAATRVVVRHAGRRLLDRLVTGRR